MTSTTHEDDARRNDDDTQQEQEKEQQPRERQHRTHLGLSASNPFRLKQTTAALLSHHHHISTITTTATLSSLLPPHQHQNRAIWLQARAHACSSVSGGLQMPPVNGLCVWCLEHSAQCLKCSRCGGPWYCSRDCQLAYLSAGHREECWGTHFIRTCVQIPRACRKLVLEYVVGPVRKRT